MVLERNDTNIPVLELAIFIGKEEKLTQYTL